MISVCITTTKILVTIPPITRLVGWGGYYIYLNHCVRCLSGFCVNDIFRTAQPFLSKLGIVKHHHELERCATKLVCYLQRHGYSEDSYSQVVTFN